MHTPLRAGITESLRTALAARDRTAVTALRSALSAIDNAEAVPADHSAQPAAASEHIAGAAGGVGAAETDRPQLTETEQRAIVQNEIDERLTNAEEYDRHGRGDRADRLRAEAAALEYQLSC